MNEPTSQWDGQLANLFFDARRAKSMPTELGKSEVDRTSVARGDEARIGTGFEDLYLDAAPREEHGHHHADRSPTDDCGVLHLLALPLGECVRSYNEDPQGATRRCACCTIDAKIDRHRRLGGAGTRSGPSRSSRFPREIRRIVYTTSSIEAMKPPTLDLCLERGDQRSRLHKPSID